MQELSTLAVIIVALLHLGFLALEMFLWTKPTGRKIFRTTQEFSLQSAALAANQGLYNGFLSAALFVGVAHPNPEIALAFKFFGLICVTVAGLYGAWTVSKTIFWVQAVPAMIALGLIAFSN